MKGNLTVVGCGICRDDLAPTHRRALAAAEVLAGGRRLLDWFPDFQGEVVELGACSPATLARLAELSRTRRVVVLASGDPLFFGIGARFAASFPELEVCFLPNVSAAQTALARLGLPWAGARFFSVHGRPDPLPWPQILAAELAVIYADPQRHPGVIARELVAVFPASSSRPAAVAENLGADERLRHGTLAGIAGQGFSGLSVLVLLPPAPEGDLTTPHLLLGEEDGSYGRGQSPVTRPEVRAVVLSKLCLGPGVLWDLGAGSGSVAVEACGLCPELRAFAVEKETTRVEVIRENARAAGLAGCQVVPGRILERMDALPAPRAVFVGGGGEGVGEIVPRAFAALRPGGRLVAAAVLLETKNQLNDLMTENLHEIVEIGVCRAVSIGPGRMMRPDNPVTLYVFEKKRSEA